VIRVIAEDDLNIDDADITVEVVGACDGPPVVHDPDPLSNWPEAIQLNYDQDHAYIALQENGLDIHDVSDRDNAMFVSNFSATSECRSQEFFADEVVLIEEEGEIDALIAGGECGVVGAEVTFPSTPTLIDIIGIPFALAEEVAWTESEDGENLILYVASFWQGLKIFEVIGECGVGGVGSCDVDERGSIGADDEWGASLAVWIVEGEGQILAYVASTDGVQIVDVTDPDAPTLLGRYDTNPTDKPLDELDDVPQDVVVAGDLAFVPLWIGGFLVIDVTDPANPVLFQPVIPASAGSAFFKVDVSTHENRIQVTEGLYGVAVYNQDSETGLLGPVPEMRIPIGVGDSRCSFVNGKSDICWAWAIDEHHELLGVTYGVTSAPIGGGFQLITMPENAVDGEVLEILRARPVPEPHLLLLQGIGVFAVAGLARLRRRRRGPYAPS
jgi:hypothetical protein